MRVRSVAGGSQIGRRDVRRLLGRRAVGIEPAISGAPVAVHAHDLGDARTLEGLLEHGGVRPRPFGGLRFVGSPGHRHAPHRIEHRFDRTQPGWRPLPLVHDGIVACTALPIARLVPLAPGRPPTAAGQSASTLAISTTEPVRVRLADLRAPGERDTWYGASKSARPARRRTRRSCPRPQAFSLECAVWPLSPAFAEGPAQRRHDPRIVVDAGWPATDAADARPGRSSRKRDIQTAASVSSAS